MKENYQWLDKKMSLLSKFIMLLIFILTLTTTDLIIKETVNKKLKFNNLATVIENFWYHGYVENDDLGLSILRGITKNLEKSHKKILMVTLQSLGVLVVLVFFFKAKEFKYILPLSFIISGALGNLIDRIIRGFVIDYVFWYFKFIKIDFFNPFPIFNLADVITLIGAFLLFIVILFFTKEEKKDYSLEEIKKEEEPIPPQNPN